MRAAERYASTAGFVSRVDGDYPVTMTETKSANERPYDIVVWGASGFTGRLVVEYLWSRYGDDKSLRWAAAGRNNDKVRKVIADITGDESHIPTLIANSDDEESLDAIATSTKVVITTVGPYARYGSKLIAACVRHGAHYCDLAGEAQWMQSMIDTHQDAAVRSGARVVHSCGFDSIPSDIGTLLLQQAAIEKTGEPCNEITLLVKATRGGASGGTIASMFTAMEQAGKDRNIARALANPYSLNPVGQRTGPDGRDQTNIRYHEAAGSWTGPFIMAMVNTRIVRRSNALMANAYGDDFRYHEATLTGPGWRGWIRAAVLTTAIGVFILASSNTWLRRNLVQKLVPKPGEGPSEDQRDNGFFNLKLIGRLRSGDFLRMTVKGDRDPGYGSTSKMLAESAVCLARDELVVGGGFWTPASALGNQLSQRLIERAGLSFELDS